MLVGRSRELAALGALRADVLAGRGRALVLRGDAGIGKSTLLDALAARCDGDVCLLRARGVQGEAELAFSGLSDLLAPIADRLAMLPAPNPTRSPGRSRSGRRSPATASPFASRHSACCGRRAASAQ